jgi:putative membrane protein
MVEVQMGQLARQNATSTQVKQFGEQMVTDHTQANQEPRQIAQQENLQLPAQPSSKDQATARQPGNLKGSAFDSAYSRDMVRDHQQDVADFHKEARSGQDPALTSFARDTSSERAAASAYGAGADAQIVLRRPAAMGCDAGEAFAVTRSI